MSGYGLPRIETNETNKQRKFGDGYGLLQQGSGYVCGYLSCFKFEVLCTGSWSFCAHTLRNSARLAPPCKRGEVERERDQARSDWLNPIELVLPRPLIPAKDRNPETARL